MFNVRFLLHRSFLFSVHFASWCWIYPPFTTNRTAFGGRHISWRKRFRLVLYCYPTIKGSSELLWFPWSLLFRHCGFLKLLRFIIVLFTPLLPISQMMQFYAYGQSCGNTDGVTTVDRVRTVEGLQKKIFFLAMYADGRPHFSKSRCGVRAVA